MLPQNAASNKAVEASNTYAAETVSTNFMNKIMIMMSY